MRSYWVKLSGLMILCFTAWFYFELCLSLFGCLLLLWVFGPVPIFGSVFLLSARLHAPIISNVLSLSIQLKAVHRIYERCAVTTLWNATCITRENHLCVYFDLGVVICLNVASCGPMGECTALLRQQPQHVFQEMLSTVALLVVISEL